jgi:dihydrolipoamide dehydrogenase
MAGMDRYDLVIVGAGAAGEAAAFEARELGGSVAVIERDLFGGGCPFWQCMPSKALLHASAVHAAGGDFPWKKASDFRDWMIVREGIDYPDDGDHVKALEDAGATTIRGEARFIGRDPLRLSVSRDGQQPMNLEAGAVILAVGSHSKIPDLPGLEQGGYWTNRQGTSLRALPSSVVVLGAGPSGVELAQVYARYGVAVTIVHPRDRIHDREHPLSSRYLAEGLERDGVQIHLNARATGVRPGAGANGTQLIELSDGTTVEGEAILMTIGREVPLDSLGLPVIGVETEKGQVRPDDRLGIAPDVYVAGDIAGPELHTHLAHYQGELTARLALGHEAKPDFSAIPRATYTDPETASVGLLLEQAKERGIDAIELTQDVAKTAKGQATQSTGHVTIVVDRQRRVLVGAFMAGPAVSEAIHEAVLAVKLGTPIPVLADTIHAFPTIARVLGSLFIEADKKLAGD